MGEQRVKWIDALKGFATLLAVVGHVVSGYSGAGLYEEHSAVLAAISGIIYSFHMALFFSVSGMTYRLAYYKPGPQGSELKSRERYIAQIVNLIIIYFLYCFLMGVFKICFSRFVNSNISLADIILIWGKPIYPYWFLYVLIAFYFIFSIDKIRNGNLWLTALVLLTVSILSTQCVYSEWFQIQRIMLFSPFFYYGMASVDCKMLRDLKVCIIGFLAFWGSRNTVIFGISIVTVFKMTGIVMLIAGVFSTIKLFEQDRILNYLGRHSLEIFLLHCFFTAGNRTLFKLLGVTNVYISIIANTLVSIVVSLLIAAVAKKIGIYHLLFKPVVYVLRRTDPNAGQESASRISE